MIAIVHSIYSQSVHALALNAGSMDNHAGRYCTCDCSHCTCYGKCTSSTLSAIHSVSISRDVCTRVTLSPLFTKHSRPVTSLVINQPLLLYL